MNNKLYDYSPMTERPKLKLPNDARVALWVGLNIEHYEVDKPSTSIYPGTAGLVPDPMNYGWRDYGVRVGIWRVMETLDKLGLRASVLLNSDVCAQYPQIITEGNKRNWCWLAHGKNNSTLQANMPLEEEKKYLEEVVQAIESSTGHRPKGWLGPALTETFNTPEILAGLGLTYLLDWCSDDQPFSLNVKTGKMISVPYSIEVNDITLFLCKNASEQRYCQVLMDQFNQLYEESNRESARVVAIPLHPFVVGQPFRIKYLEKALEHMVQHKDVWLATSDEIAEWHLQNNCLEENPKHG